MEKSKIYVGLEIGTSKICMVVGEVKADGAVKILGVGKTPSAGVRYGQIMDMSSVRVSVKRALLEAEENSNVDIQSVFLCVSGKHISSMNNRGTFRLPEGETVVSAEHIDEVKDIARDTSLPSENTYIHHFIRQFWLDRQVHIQSPVGLTGSDLEAEFHIIHGITNQLHNSMRCVRELSLELETIVFSPVAAAQIILSRKNKDDGALVVDIGGGTTDYVLYVDGSIVASGSLPVGGEHISNDISLRTGVPFSKADKLKKLEGDASKDPVNSVGIVTVTDENGFPEEKIERAFLNRVIVVRLEMIFNLIKQRIPEEYFEQVAAGVFLTGGTSLLKGITDVAEDVFELPVVPPADPDISGVRAHFKDPEYSAAVGVIRYAQKLEQELEAIKKPSVLKKVSKIFWPL
ncbi:cell division protein FtsA [Akkermansiaceae bacterium]|nr:cell division protein FtsA [Akkermansiaceae bacterium]